MKKRILVVDDEPDNTQLMKMVLEARGDYQVFEENNAANAINTARRCDPDVIILDIVMPGRSGNDVAADLREDSRLSEVPILFLTALDAREVTSDSNSISTVRHHHYMSKPVDMNELVKRIQGFHSK